MNVVLLGAPGAGKGTQAQLIKDRFDLPHIATGDILRAAVAAGTEVGLRAKAYMDKGELVPDEVVVAIVAERISEDDCSDGWLLDGFPRTVPQAEALDRTIAEKSLKPIDRVVYLSVSAEAAVERLSGRRVCPNTDCGASYNIEFMPPKVEGVCDRCGAKQLKVTYPRTTYDGCECFVCGRLALTCGFCFRAVVDWDNDQSGAEWAKLLSTCPHCGKILKCEEGSK